MGAKRWTGWLARKKGSWSWRDPFGKRKRGVRRFPPLRAVLDLAAFVAVVSVKAWSSKRLWDRWKTRRPKR